MQFVVERGADPRVADLIRDEVVPGLRRVIGRTIRVPATVTLTATAGAGVVRGSLNSRNGGISSVSDPQVGSLGRDIRFVAAHELAHFHELSVRCGRGGMPTGDLESSLFWTEYYANRVAHEAGFPMVGLYSRPGDDAVQASENSASGNPDAESSDRLGPAYLVTLLLARKDVAPDDKPPKLTLAHAKAFALHELGILETLYRNFPNWDAASRRRLVSAVSVTMGPAPADSD